MIVSDFVTACYYKATGKVASFASGSVKWNKILALANIYIDNWQNEPGVDWASLYNPAYSVGTVTATDSFALNTSVVRKLSKTDGDYVRIFWTDGVGYTDYEIVPADKLKNYYAGQNKEYFNGYYCAQIGSNLVFNHKFISTDPEYGGTIYAPIYGFADHLVNDSDVIPVDNPNWLVFMTAAEYIRNDITRQNQYPTIIAEANDIMTSMKEANEAQADELIMPWQPLAQEW